MSQLALQAIERKAEQLRIMLALLDHVRDVAVSRLADIPSEWDGEELRELVHAIVLANHDRLPFHRRAEFERIVLGRNLDLVKET